jgi:hypothetical protein
MVFVIVTREVQIRQIEHSGFEGLHCWDIGYPAERFWDIPGSQ